MESESKSLSEVRHMEQCLIYEYKDSCYQFEAYCTPCDGDSEECLTCNCLNAGYELRTKELEHAA